jgi:two-component system sensor histidine kinase TctE
MPMQPMHPTPDRVPGRRRWLGIRAQLLALILPGVALMLAIDSWSDHHARTSTLESAYDEALLEPLSVLDDSVHIDANGEVVLATPFAVQAMFESLRAHHKHLHVGLSPLDTGAGTPPAERTLMGVSDLPAPPPDAELTPPPPSFGGADGGHIAFYTAAYHGYPVRVATLRRELMDAAGRRYRLQVRAAESTDRRADARQASLRREFQQDLRMLAVTALLVWLGIAWALRPLKRLRASLRERPTHDLQPLDASGVPYEVAPLVDAVNIHIADHRQMLAEQGRFLADASHQLRTPLAIMMTQAGYALRERDPHLLRETLRAIISELDRSRRLTDQLLAMAHASRAADDAEPPPRVDLNAVAREVVLQYLPLAHVKNQDLGWVDIRGEDIPDGADPGTPAAPVRAQAAELHEALANLLHNAIRHTPAGGSITVAVRIEGDVALAEVADGGPGIAPERREAVFERFGRGNAADAADTAGMAGGAGLGLAIARAYARRNGGDIELADFAANSAGAVSRTTGLRAILRLPLASDRQG